MSDRTASTKALASLGYVEIYRTVTDDEDGGVTLRYAFPGLTVEVSIAPEGRIDASAHSDDASIAADPIYPPEGE